MTETALRWAVAPAGNLVGIARLEQQRGERAAVSCGGRTFLHIVLTGTYEVPDGQRQLELGAGDIYLVRLPEEDETEAERAPVASSDAATVLTASFSAQSTALHTLVSTLPGTLHISAAQVRENPPIAGMLELLRQEFEGTGCGRELLSGHLLEALFLYVIRYWYDRLPQASCLIDAFGDPQLSRVIERIHHKPGHAWTLEELASVAGMSRAAFARQFKARIGETPLGYVTSLRMNLAAQMLDQAVPIRKISHAVGYGSEFAFSRTFSRHHGMPPTHYRNRQKAA